MRTVPLWRLIAGGLVLGVIATLGFWLAPIYLRNLEFQRFVDETAVDARDRSRTDDEIRARVVDRADQLRLPIHSDDIQIKREPDAVIISSRYVVHVNFAVYAVDLHFHTGNPTRQ